MKKFLVSILLVILAIISSPIIFMVGFMILGTVTDFYYKLHRVKITAIGFVSREGLSCFGSGTSAKAIILHSSEPYELVEDEHLPGKKYPIHFEGKYVRVQGITNGGLTKACFNGKRQNIQYITVTDIEPL